MELHARKRHTVPFSLFAHNQILIMVKHPTTLPPFEKLKTLHTAHLPRAAFVRCLFFFKKPLDVYALLLYSM